MAVTDVSTGENDISHHMRRPTSCLSRWLSLSRDVCPCRGLGYSDVGGMAPHGGGWLHLARQQVGEASHDRTHLAGVSTVRAKLTSFLDDFLPVRDPIRVSDRVTKRTHTAHRIPIFSTLTRSMPTPVLPYVPCEYYTSALTRKISPRPRRDRRLGTQRGLFRPGMSKLNGRATRLSLLAGAQLSTCRVVSCAMCLRRMGRRRISTRSLCTWSSCCISGRLLPCASMWYRI